MCQGKGRYENFTKTFAAKMIRPEDGKVVATATSEQVDLAAQYLKKYKNPYEGP